MSGFAKFELTGTGDEVAPIRLEELHWRNGVSQIIKLPAMLERRPSIKTTTHLDGLTI